MMTRLYHLTLSVALGAFGLLALAGCEDSTRTTDSVTTTDPAQTTPGTASTGTATSNDACSVHLFDGDNFEDDNIVITGAGRYGDLSNLPGTSKNWTREADSFRLGSGATMTVWPESNFSGASRTFDPGTEVADLDGEIGSLELTC